MTRITTTATGLVLLLATALLLAPSTAHAEPDLSKINLGSYVTGPKITKNDLKGRFVIVEYWGINCGPCIASIPHITKLAEEYGHSQLVIVANHAQGGSDAQVKEKWESRAKSNYVAVVNGGNLPGTNVRGIPDTFLFAPNGKYLWNGHPNGVEKALKDAMKRYRVPKKEKVEEAAPDPIVTGIEPQYFKRQIEDINEQSRSIDAPLAQLRRASERSSKEEQKAEANAILATVAQFAKSQQDTIDKTIADDPATAYAMTDQAIELFGRDDLATSFTETKSKMESDDALMDRVRSMRKLREVIAEAESIGLTKDAAKANSDRKNTRTLRSIERDLGLIVKTWPETDAAKQAESFRTAWGLNG